MDGYEPRTYGDAFADVYDDWYGDLDDAGAAVETIAGLARDGAVLELGVGSGRLAAPLAAAGTTVWGIDASTAMLARLAARPGGDAVHAVLGDMADPVGALADAGVDPPPRFAVVVAAFNTFFLLPSETTQAACLDGVSQLLAPGGVVALECFVPGDAGERVERVVEPRRVAVDHVVLTVTTHDAVAQLVHGQHVELREAGTRLRPWMLRYATPGQLDALAADAGLRLRQRWSGWDGGTFGDDSVMHVSLYEAG